ncbi:hypothetical protein [Saccharopolyspora cebuensis]|uniref:PEP-CTERM protein-sorting domain-containing protein n=1 Tax=Saccharopolyspora cebuensis TaxID=418759 RepID=A0ABV4CN25_9PSEU
MDPISLVVGGVLLALGFAAGRFGRVRSKARAKEQITASCGCGHGLDQHDPEDGTCHAELRRSRYVDGGWDGHEYVPCTCRQYVGPRPVEELFAPKYLPPSG